MNYSDFISDKRQDELFEEVRSFLIDPVNETPHKGEMFVKIYNAKIHKNEFELLVIGSIISYIIKEIEYAIEQKKL